MHGNGLDRDGFIEREGDLARIPEAFGPVVEGTKAAILSAFALDRLHSAYLYGSIPRGTAVPGTSDLDVLLAMHDEPTDADRVSPPGIRIADASRVRLGAHLAEGSVVMHEGFVNFNAGTLGPCMVEGRITQGSVVDAGADIGAGSSIMGTLSGGGTHISRIGKRCLLGANAGTGISLGDDSAIEAGLYVTRGTLVSLPDGRIIKAIELSGTPGILFRRHSVSGAVEAVPWKSSAFAGLNDALHA